MAAGESTPRPGVPFGPDTKARRLTPAKPQPTMVFRPPGTHDGPPPTRNDDGRRPQHARKRYSGTKNRVRTVLWRRSQTPAARNTVARRIAYQAPFRPHKRHE